MAYATINKGSSYFNTVLYTGTGSTQSITGVGFQPDFVWIKSRSNAYNNMLFDVLRGAGTSLFSNSTTGDEVNSPTSTTSFDSNGFSLGTNIQVNNSGSTFVNWSWKANGTGVSNTAGTISSTVSANTTSGFSIVSYTGSGSLATVGHGLGVAPKAIIVKARSATVDWVNYFSALGADKFLKLNLANAVGTSTGVWGNTAPTSTVFTVDSSGTNNDPGVTYIAYCFADVKGYSKFSSYTGNGSTDGSFVYTGFKPAFVMMKRSDSTGNWSIYNNKTPAYNVENLFLLANGTGAEETRDSLDFLSNGFKLRNTDLNGNTNINLSGATYIYMAFAENPFVLTDGTPVTAR